MDVVDVKLSFSAASFRQKIMDEIRKRRDNIDHCKLTSNKGLECCVMSRVHKIQENDEYDEEYFSLLIQSVIHTSKTPSNRYLMSSFGVSLETISYC